MNQAQFDIVKSFQKMGARPTDLAKHFKESSLNITKAYAMNKFGSIFGI